MAKWQWQQRWARVIEQLDVVADDAAAQQLLGRLAAPQTVCVLGFVNAHAMNLVVRDGAYCQALSAADVQPAVLAKPGSKLHRPEDASGRISMPRWPSVPATVPKGIDCCSSKESVSDFVVIL